MQRIEKKIHVTSFDQIISELETVVKMIGRHF